MFNRTAVVEISPQENIPGEGLFPFRMGGLFTGVFWKYFKCFLEHVQGAASGHKPKNMCIDLWVSCFSDV